MNEHQMWAQALGLKDTAETMIKAGRGGDFAEPVSRAAVNALLETAKRLKADNAVVAGKSLIRTFI